MSSSTLSTDAVSFVCTLMRDRAAIELETSKDYLIESRLALVVDDSGTMRKIIIRSLNAVGIAETVEACDGNEGLKAFQEQPFKMVLTDWNMPNKSGLELTKDIRALNPTVPIFMITTEAEKTRVVEAIQAGVSDYLVKPFTSEALRQKLEKFCP